MLSLFKLRKTEPLLERTFRAPGTLFLGKKVDAAAPFVLAPGEAAVVVYSKSRRSSK